MAPMQSSDAQLGGPAPPSPDSAELAESYAALLGPEAVFAAHSAGLQGSSHSSAVSSFKESQVAAGAAVQPSVVAAGPPTVSPPSQAKRRRGQLDQEHPGVRSFAPRLPGTHPRPGSTKWVPAAGTVTAANDASAKQQCSHARRTKPSSAGCHWVCSDCGEQLWYEGWRMEYSSLGRMVPRGGPTELAAAQSLAARQPQFQWDLTYEDGYNDFIMLNSG